MAAFGGFYVANEYWFSVFQLVTAMIGMGATLKPADFKELWLEPKAVAAGSLVQLAVVPLIALAFISVFGLSGGVAVGVALIAAVPGGSTSNIFTHFARGNVALSIAITSLTTLACLLTTPIILELLISSYMPADFVMPRGQIMQEIALTLLLPLALGMLYLKFIPSSAELFSRWCVRISLFGLALIVVGAASSGRLDLKMFGLGNAALIILFILLLALISYGLSKVVLRLSQADAIAVDMEVVVRNINLGLMLKALLFPAIAGQQGTIGDIVLLCLLLYGGAQIFVAAILIALRRHAFKTASQQSSKPEPEETASA